MKKNEIISPFPGLRSFRTDEGNLFFGRENETRDLLNLITSYRFVSVIGTSGSGKSSLISSGVIPALSDRVKGDKAGLRIIEMRPGKNPLSNLSSALVSGEGLLNGKTRNRIDELLANKNTTLDSLLPLLGLKGNEEFVLVIDQFEELFRYRENKAEANLTADSKVFVNLLVEAVNNKAGRFSVIIGMRSEFIGECAHFQGLTELINRSSYLVPLMSADNYRQVIEGPVHVAGAEIEKGLVQRLIDEIGERTDQLPVLQHVLMRTWEHWKRSANKDIPISPADYDTTGKMREAMSKHADEAFMELDERGREICEVLFKTITEKGSDNSGLRHPTQLNVIAQISRCSPQELYRIIDTFRAPGRSFLLPQAGTELTPDTVIDISHESLIRIWDRLAEWLEEETSSVRMYQKLSEASELFQQGKTTLLRNPELQMSINWRGENMPTLKWAERINPAFERAMVFLRTSEKEYQSEEESKARFQKWRIRRSRIAAMILGSAAVVSLVFMSYAFIKQGETERSRREAEGRRQLALQQEELAVKRAEALAEQRNLALLDVRKSMDDAEAANLRMQREISMSAEARSIAREAERIADQAVLNERIASEKSIENARLRMLSVSRSMAVKSLQDDGQDDLQVLLAYQAYTFNKRNRGASNDPDIYLGLYNVAKVHGGRGYLPFNGHTGQVYSVSFIPDEQAFISSGSDGNIFRWSLDNPGSKPELLKSGGTAGVLSVSNDGALLACAGYGSTIRVIPLRGGVDFDLQGHTGEVNSLVYSPSESVLYSSGTDGEILKWNMSSKEYSVVADMSDTIYSIDISKSGRYLAGASTNGVVRIWNLGDSEETDQVPVENGRVNTVRFRGDDLLAVGFSNGMVELWDISNNSMIAEFRSHGDRVNDIRFNDKLNQIATCGVDGYVMIWNMADLTEPPVSIGDNGGFVNTLAYSHDGSTIISGGKVGSAGLYARASHVDYMAQGVCNLVSRNLTEEEWARYVGRDIKFEQTCNSSEFRIKIQDKKGE